MMLQSAEVDGVEHTIIIKNFNFSPLNLQVQVGDTITWINQDIVPHTATAKDDSWDTGELKQGESATIEVTDKFSLAYFCFYHPMMIAELKLAE